MTRTEDRLADALDAVARSVKQESLPPLPTRGPSPGRQRWGRWLAPAAAAASVVLVVVLVSAIRLFSGTPGRPAQTAGPPRYYAVVTGGITSRLPVVALPTGEGIAIQIHKTATGALVENVPNPYSGHGSSGMSPVDVTATDGGREFIAAYTGTPPHVRTKETRLYSFRLTAAGHATRLSPVKGGVITGLDASGAMAVSPDGSRVAVALAAPLTIGQSVAPPPEIAVIDLSTGARSVWSGGLERSGLTFSIQSVSWGPGPGSVAFLAQWCQYGVAGGFCGAGRHAAQVRTLRLSTGGGRLSAGGVVLSESARYPNIVQALLSPNGKALTMVVLHGPYVGRTRQPRNLQVVQVPLAGGGGQRLLYHGRVGNGVQVFLGSDATGRYPILAWRLNGWLDHGMLRPLAPSGGTSLVEAW